MPRPFNCRSSASEWIHRFEQYGIDSVLIMALTRQLEKNFGSLPKTLFFEYGNIRELAAYFNKSLGTRPTEVSAQENPEAAEALPQENLEAAEVLHQENLEAAEVLHQENSEAAEALPQENPEAAGALSQENSEAVEVLHQENPEPAKALYPEDPEPPAGQETRMDLPFEVSDKIRSFPQNEGPRQDPAGTAA